MESSDFVQLLAGLGGPSHSVLYYNEDCLAQYNNDTHIPPDPADFPYL